MLKIKKEGECIRSVSNFSKQNNFDKFDKPSFDTKKFRENIKITSPKLHELLDNINKLDEEDMKIHKKHFKHFIYTDIKKSSSGAKMLAAGLNSNGFTNIYDNKLKLVDEIVEKGNGKNFALLSSVQIYGKPFPVKLKKKILEIYNKRPDNIQGDNLRFIILDQGFKEGIDLFDVKYVHLFEPLITSSDEKQAIGRATRFCGQKGLEFINNKGWILNIFKYDILFNKEDIDKYDANTGEEFFLNNSGLNIKNLLFANELENISRYGAIDYELNNKIHNNHESNTKNIFMKYKGFNNDKEVISIKPKASSLNIIKDKNNIDKYANKHYSIGGGIKGKKKKGLNIYLERAPQKIKNFENMRNYIKEKFQKYKWDDIKYENKCIEKEPEDLINKDKRLIDFTPTQQFITKYFDNTSAYKGLLLWHSVGTGKTCSAISIASSGFEPHGYTILWVTRHTLKSDVWKNIFNNVCSAVLRKKIEKGEKVPDGIPRGPLKYLSNSWIMPISYKQFSNMLLEKNDIYKIMKKRNGSIDPLKKTIVIIDEVHKLYSNDLPSAERPNMNILKEKIYNSYKISGDDSVRLLLMTATPYTTNPIDLIKLINLMKDKEHLPENFEDFSEKYLDNNGKFTEKGAENYLNSISGYISYLNREKDIRQFANPIFKNIYVNPSKSIINDNMDEYNNKLIELNILLKEPEIKKDKENIKNIKNNIKDIKNLIKENKKVIKDNSKNDLSQEVAYKKCYK